MKPKSSPGAAPAPARAPTASSTAPPAGTVTDAGTLREAPEEDDWGRTSTLQAPAPPPASAIVTARAPEAGPRGRRREALAAGCGQVGLQLVAERLRAAGGEARDDAASPGCDLERVVPDEGGRPPAVRGEVVAEPRAVEVGDHETRERG